MITWAIEDGDLQIGPNGFASLTGAQKIQQDLYCATAEPYGSDPYHPGWGCLLGNYIGSVNNSSTEMLAQSEIARVINNYIIVQQSRMQALANAGLANQYNAADIVSGTSSINIVQNDSNISIDVEVNTQDGNTTPISTTVGS